MNSEVSQSRSENMRRVRGKDTGPEICVRKWLHAAGYRFRLHRKDVPGRPDVFLPRYRTAIFVHGCFWHGHEGCKRATIPKTRTEFWAAKIDRNGARDRRVAEELEAGGYRRVTIWECELADPGAVIERVDAATGRIGRASNAA